MLQNSLGVVGQREATVAASVICWLGTNCGRFFLNNGRRLASRGNLSKEDALLAKWAMCNRRQIATNCGLRALELMLLTDEDVRLNRLCQPTNTDYETAEQVLAWLGRAAGHAFLKHCEMEIARHAMLEQVKHTSRAKRMGPVGLATVRRLEAALVNGTNNRELRA